MVDAIAEGLYGVREDYAATLDDDNGGHVPASIRPHGEAAVPSLRRAPGGSSNVPVLIEDYGLIGDLQAAALVSRHGCLDWLCLLRFDSGAVFAALVGEPENGHWTIQPQGEFTSPGRRYRGDSLVLETTFRRRPARRGSSTSCRRGRRSPTSCATSRACAGESRCAWSSRSASTTGPSSCKGNLEGTLVGIAGPDAVALHTPVELEGRNLRTHAEFSVSEGDHNPFVLTWFPSNEPPPKPVDPGAALSDTLSFWDEWAGKCRYKGRWHEAVRRSLVTLKALTHAPTGGIVAAPTTSLPEALGGPELGLPPPAPRRDPHAARLVRAGYLEEQAWRDWLLRVIAGSPDDVQIMHGVAGERRSSSSPGSPDTKAPRRSESATPRRSASSTVYGEVVDASTAPGRRVSRRPTPGG